MNLAAFAAVGVGAACGAWLRWGLGLWLNPLFVLLPRLQRIVARAYLGVRERVGATLTAISA